VTERDGTGRSAWAAPATALAFIAVVVALIALPAAEHRPLQAGLLDTLLRFDRSLPLVGLGLLLAEASRREMAASALLLLVGLGLGAVAGARIATAIEEDFTLVTYLFTLGPLLCLAVGGALVAPRTVRGFASPAAAFLSGLVLAVGLLAELPGALGAEYLAGSALAILAAILVPLLILRDIRSPGLSVATRIAGSWLIAIGLMLLALELGGARG
jgi:hypothetical protein